MHFHELGALLKARREELGISREEISQKIKIPVRSVIAIENGIKEDLPHEIYIRTFIKGYANCVEYTEEEINSQFIKIDDFNENSVSKTKTAYLSADKTERKTLKSFKILIIFILLAVLGIGTYWFFYKKDYFDMVYNSITSVFDFSDEEDDQNQDLPNDLEINENNEVNTSSDASDQIENNTDEFVLQNSDIAMQNSSNLSQDGNVLQEGSAAGDQLENSENADSEDKNLESADDSVQDANKVESSETIAMSQESETVENETENKDLISVEALLKNDPKAKRINWDILETPKAGEQQAVMHVTGDCWMSVNVDGKSSYFTLKKNNQREFLFKRNIVFQLGNAGVVTLYHNRKLVNIGDSSELRTVELGKK